MLKSKPCTMHITYISRGSALQPRPSTSGGRSYPHSYLPVVWLVAKEVVSADATPAAARAWTCPARHMARTMRHPLNSP